MEERLRSNNAFNIEMLGVQQDKEKSDELRTARRRNKSSIKQNLLQNFNNFCFGLKKARERETTPTEKMVWLLMFASCFFYCGFLIWKSYSKWMKSPSIVMLTENDQPIRHIPFPAVTVCPEWKIISTVFSFKAFLLNKTKGNLTEKEQHMFEDASLICNYDSIPKDGRHFSFGNETVRNIRKSNESTTGSTCRSYREEPARNSVVALLIKYMASPKLSQVISICSWKGRQKACENMFTPIITEEGMCFTFNTIGPKDLFQLENLNTDYEYMDNLIRTKNQGWTLEYGYLPNAPRITYPIRGSHQSVHCLAVGSRFLEIGKLDLSNNTALGMSVFLKNTTFHGILLDALFGAAGEGDDKVAVVRCVTDGIASGAVRPLPATVFGERELEPAFRYMAAGKHIGKGAGPKAGLELKLTEMEKGLDRDCKRRLSGFKILLHTPCDLPRPSQQYIRIPTYEEVMVAFTATQEFTSDGLEVFTPLTRQCYFENERSLKYFKIYTQSNCDYECLTNFTYARCGCVHFSMPHGPDMPICNIGSLNCMSKAEMELSTMDIEDEGWGNVTNKEAIRIADACNCLPGCTSITYDTEVIQTEIQEFERHSYAYNNNSHGDHILTKSKISKVVIFFKRALFDVSKRSELYGTSDILASCGGLLGLFMGFSVINIVEIFYFCILRVCRRHQAEKCKHSNDQTVEQPMEKY